MSDKKKGKRNYFPKPTQAGRAQPDDVRSIRKRAWQRRKGIDTGADPLSLTAQCILQMLESGEYRQQKDIAEACGVSRAYVCVLNRKRREGKL